MLELLDRLFGFMPNRSVLWTAILTTVLALTIQSTHNWFKSMAILPWQREDNQQKRLEILQGKSIKQKQKGISNK